MIESREHAATGLRSCVQLAQRVDAEVHVIDVSEPPPRWRRGRAGGDDAEVHRRRQMVERFVSNIPGEGVGMSIAVRQGKRIVELVHEVAGAGVDLLVIVAAPRRVSSATVEAFASRVVRKAPVPVLVLRPSEPGGGEVVAAVDVFADGDDLAGTILGNGASLAAPDSVLTVLHVVDAGGPASGDEHPAELIAAAVADARQGVADLVAARLAGPAGERVVVEVRSGSPVEEIAAAVASQQPWLLSVGTVSRGGIRGLMLGTTAEALLRTVDCSVLATKPAGFRSPLL